MVRRDMNGSLAGKAGVHLTVDAARMECHSSYIGQHKNSGPLSELKEEDKMRLKEQSSRLVPDFKARKFQSEAR